MNLSLYFILLSLLAGMMIPFQSAMNANLSKNLQSPYFSAFTVFVVAAVGILSYILITKQTVPSVSQYQTASWWSYLGGILGGAYILLIVICAPKLGIGNVTVLVLLGQIISAMLIDQFGLLQAPVHHVNWQRLIGVALMIAGVYLVKKY